jgi:hypothetical protein
VRFRNRSAQETYQAARAATYSSGYLPQFGLLGGHSGAGPNSALSIGVAIATYVQAKPTIRINILTARFILGSPYLVRSPWERNLTVAELYRTCASSVGFSCGQRVRIPDSASQAWTAWLEMSIYFSQIKG